MGPLRRARRRRRSDLVSILTQCRGLKSRSFERCPKIIVESSPKIGRAQPPAGRGAPRPPLSEGSQKERSGVLIQRRRGTTLASELMKLVGVFIPLPRGRRADSRRGRGRGRGGGGGGSAEAGGARPRSSVCDPTCARPGGNWPVSDSAEMSRQLLRCTDTDGLPPHPIQRGRSPQLVGRAPSQKKKTPYGGKIN